AHPELEMGAARTIKGINYKTLVRTALPTVGFRSANSGSPLSKGTYENRMFEAYMFNPQWEVDKMVAESYEDGTEDLIAMEAGGQMEASSIALCKQFYYGTGALGDALGFPGLLASVDSTMVIDAGGTTDNIASSVWAVRFGPQWCQWIWGLN